jgi:hypothetical protein
MSEEKGGKMKKVFSTTVFMCISFLFVTWCLCQAAHANPVISVAPMSVNLGNIPVGVTSASKTVTITNKGTSDLSLDSITITGTNALEFTQINNCTIISTGLSCSVTVALTPAVPYGKKSAILSIVSNDPKKPTVNIKLSGYAPPPKISASPMSVDLGSVPVGSTSSPKIVTVKNTGISDLIINSITLSGTNASEFRQTNDCTTVPAKGSCTVSVTFVPTISFGKKSAVISIASNDAKKPTVNVKLSGQAPSPKISASPMSVNLGSVPVGSTSSPKIVTVKNTGISDLMINSITLSGTNASEFSQTNDCTRVSKGGSCFIAVILTPTSAGSKSAVLSISSDDPKKTIVNIKLAGTGSGTGGLYSLADLAGIWEFNGLASGPDAPWWIRGPLTVSVNGTFSGLLEEFQSDPDNWAGTFNITGDGIVTIVGNSNGKCNMDSGKSTIVCTSTFGSGSPSPTTTQISVMTKKAALYSIADLAGTWEMSGLGTPGPWWSRGTFTINSDGFFSGISHGSDGSNTPMSGTFSITSDGIISAAGSGIHPSFRCVMNSGKSIVVCTNTTFGGQTDMHIFTRKDVSYSMADLVGTWDGNSLASGPGAPWWERAALTIYQDGAFTASTTESTGSKNTISGRFAISPDEVITVQGPDTAQCALDSGKTLMVCTATWSRYKTGSTEIKIFVK